MSVCYADSAGISSKTIGQFVEVFVGVSDGVPSRTDVLNNLLMFWRNAHIVATGVAKFSVFSQFWVDQFPRISRGRACLVGWLRLPNHRFVVGHFSFERSVPDKMVVYFLDSFEEIGVCESLYKFVHISIEHQFLMIVKPRYYRVVTFFENMFGDSI